MLKRKLSLSEAYSAGLKCILDNYIYFLVAGLAGVIVAGLLLMYVGYIDGWNDIMKHFSDISKFVHESMKDAGGALSHSKHSADNYAQQWLPGQLSQFFSNLKQVNFHIDRAELAADFAKIVPGALVFKFLVDLVGIGYIKMAFAVKDKKKIGWNYLYENYHLVPKYFVVNVIVHVIMIAAFAVVNMIAGGFSFFSVLFLLPGVYLYQRLRLAKFFVVDKNHSIDQALKASWKATADCWGHLTAFSVVEMMVNALGHMLILTSFIVFPLSYQVEANVYRQVVK